MYYYQINRDYYSDCLYITIRGENNKSLFYTRHIKLNNFNFDIVVEFQINIKNKLILNMLLHNIYKDCYKIFRELVNKDLDTIDFLTEYKQYRKNKIFI